ncbi:hypothetical protein A2U01_0035195, partial [Trifolium medium]|nr:hypothetical protein [Trifolium medium]
MVLAREQQAVEKLQLLKGVSYESSNLLAGTTGGGWLCLGVAAVSSCR